MRSGDGNAAEKLIPLVVRRVIARAWLKGLLRPEIAANNFA
jgi:hypothetical protein